MGGKSHHTFDTFLPKVSERSQNLQTPFQAPFLSFLSSLPSVPFSPPSRSPLLAAAARQERGEEEEEEEGV